MKAWKDIGRTEPAEDGDRVAVAEFDGATLVQEDESARPVLRMYIDFDCVLPTDLQDRIGEAMRGGDLEEAVRLAAEAGKTPTSMRRVSNYEDSIRRAYGLNA